MRQQQSYVFRAPTHRIMHFQKSSFLHHYSDATTSAMAYQITSRTIVYSTVYSGADQSRSKKTSKLRVAGLCAENSAHKGQSREKRFLLMTSKMSTITMYNRLKSLAPFTQFTLNITNIILDVGNPKCKTWFYWRIEYQNYHWESERCFI